MKRKEILMDYSSHNNYSSKNKYVTLGELRDFIGNIRGEDSLVIDVESGDSDFMGQFEVLLFKLIPESDEEFNARKKAADAYDKFKKKQRLNTYLELKKEFDPFYEGVNGCSGAVTTTVTKSTDLFTYTK